MPRPKRRRFATAIAALAGVGGCAVGPDYKQPAIAIDAGFINAGSSSVNVRPPGTDIATFWRGFNDPALTQLIERALAANGDVRGAKARLQEARAVQGGTQASSLPEVDVAADAGRALQPLYLFPGLTRGQRTRNLFDAGFVANWELDFFGRIRRANEAAGAQVAASEAGVHAAQTAVAAEVARDYLELRGLQLRFQVAQQSLDNQQQTVRLTSARFGAGRGSQLDVVRAASLFDITQARLPVLQSAIDRDAYRLATLTAQSPRSVSASLATPEPLPSLPVTDLAAFPLGTPEQLLRRRPDLIVAERQLAAATATIGVTTAELYPRVSLTGLIGFATNQASEVGSSGAQRYAVGAGLTWPLLDFGRLRSRIAATEARTAQALANFEQTVSTALEETEGALSQFTRSAQAVARLGSSAKNAGEATRLSRIRFDAGSIDLLIVLDAERQALAARDELVQAQVTQAIGLVNVYRSLGGGWNADALAAANPGSGDRSRATEGGPP